MCASRVLTGSRKMTLYENINGMSASNVTHQSFCHFSRRNGDLRVKVCFAGERFFFKETSKLWARIVQGALLLPRGKKWVF